MEEPDWKWNLFPRLRFRLRHGYWCTHERPVPGGQTYVAPGDEWTLSIETESAFGPWHMVDPGRHKMRWCTLCHHSEFV
jgi:hypothetical protein